jgi:S-DNA-T family DNA segregation ATPase FtsK/SpoIIIE
MSKTKKSTSRAEQKRKEREDKRKKSVMNSDGTHTTWERVFWIVGLMTVLFSLYVFVASISYLSTWREDFAVLDSSLPVANACGRAGAVLAHLIISKAFGLFGMLVPIVCVLLGCSMFLGRSRVLWRSMLSVMLITICGSLTMAALPFGKDLFNSGLGGECGMSVVGLLQGGGIAYVCHTGRECAEETAEGTDAYDSNESALNSTEEHTEKSGEEIVIPLGEVEDLAEYNVYDKHNEAYEHKAYHENDGENYERYKYYVNGVRRGGANHRSNLGKGLKRDTYRTEKAFCRSNIG